MTETEYPVEGNDADDPYDLKRVLKRLGGSQSDHWNKVLVDQTVQTLCKHSNKSAGIVQLSQPAMRSQDTEREPVPGARDAERSLPDARRTVARRSEG
jgi:hypothetical protein